MCRSLARGRGRSSTAPCAAGRSWWSRRATPRSSRPPRKTSSGSPSRPTTTPWSAPSPERPPYSEACPSGSSPTPSASLRRTSGRSSSAGTTRPCSSTGYHDGIGRIPSSGTGISRYRYRHRHPVPDRYRIHPVPYPVPPLIRYRHPELDDDFGYWIPVIGYRYRQIPVPDDGPDNGRRTLSTIHKSLPNLINILLYTPLNKFLIVQAKILESRSKNPINKLVYTPFF